MSVSVRIPTILRTYTGGESEVSAEGADLAADRGGAGAETLFEPEAAVEHGVPHRL